MKKSVLCILLAFAVLIGSVCLSAAALNGDIAVTGQTRYGRDEFSYYRNEEDHSAEIIDYDSDNSSSEKDIVIPSSLDGYTVKKIGKNAFERKWKIESVSIPDTVIEIGKYAFYDCQSLKKVTLGNSVEIIATYAFAYCPLEEINFPDSLTTVGSLAFKDTTWFDNQPDGLVYAGNVLYDTKNYFPESLEITPGTKGIADRTFYNHSSLKSVVIPDSVSYLGDGAFEGCLSLEKVNIPDAVKVIYYETFSQCKSLTSITIPDSVTSIGYNAFADCISLSEIHIPASVAEIDWRAFYGDHFRIITVDNNNSCYDSREDCSALIETATDTLIKGSENAFIPDTVKAIHHFAFDGLNTITSITIPDSVTSIGNHAIYDCTSLKSVTIPASVTSIGDYAIGYYYGIIYQSKWVTEYGEKKISGFTIKGYNDTEAQRYAQSNGITFISLGEKPTEAPTEPPVLLGDADGNGEVDLVDATVIQRHTTMIAVPYDESQLMCADIDGDGSLTIVDATFIQRYATHIMTPYKIGEAVD